MSLSPDEIIAAMLDNLLRKVAEMEYLDAYVVGYGDPIKEPGCIKLAVPARFVDRKFPIIAKPSFILNGSFEMPELNTFVKCSIPTEGSPRWHYPIMESDLLKDHAFNNALVYDKDTYKKAQKSPDTKLWRSSSDYTIYSEKGSKLTAKFYGAFKILFEIVSELSMKVGKYLFESTSTIEFKAASKIKLVVDNTTFELSSDLIKMDSKAVKVKGDLAVEGKITATDDIESDKEVTAMASGASVGLSTHLTATAVPGPAVPPTGGT